MLDLLGKTHARQLRIQDFPEVGRLLTVVGGGWAPIYDFAKISQKLHEFERIWTGGSIQNFTRSYVNPPLPENENTVEDFWR